MEHALAYPEPPDFAADTTGPGVPSAFSTPRRRLTPALRRTLAVCVTGCLFLGGALLRPDGDVRAPSALPGPAGRAVIAASAGAPAALPDLTALIAEREAALRAHPRADRTWAALGAAYVERGTRTADPASYTAAERALRRALALRPRRNVAVLDGLAELAAARGDWRSARGWGEAAVRLAPDHWPAYAALVDACQGLGDDKAAGRNLEKLSGLTAGTAVSLRTAAVYRGRGWREDAAAVLADAAARAGTPTERAALLHRGGELAWERGESADALRHFDAALAADPRYPAALAGRARALASLGRASQAAQAYRRAFAQRPAPEYALELGELYESLHLTGAARAQYGAVRARAAARRAHGVDDALVLGRFEADHGDPAAAVRGLRARWRRAPGVEAADALGWALHRAGRDTEAVEWLRRAADRRKAGGPRSGLMMYHLGVVERRLGRYGAARRHLGEALRINPAFSPLFAPRARQALAALGEPPGGGPAQMWPPRPRTAAPARPKPGRAVPHRQAAERR
ncbi:tetratricopeptide repeat protein [Streptomyces sp. NPDC102406]|uniref:tetratricopeptide repeat protein n=1 Tax=Streptomyces sp. NPDC102406 TaxID=3366171 RepID=UPI0038070D3A